MNDYKMTRAVRIMLTRLRIDSTVINIHFSQGVLSLSGSVQYPFSIEGYRSEVSYELLHEMDRQFRRTEGVHQIVYIFDNWSHNCDGHWTKKSALQRRKKSGSSIHGIPA